MSTDRIGRDQVLVRRDVEEAELAAVAFLARYGGRTLEAYRQDLETNISDLGFDRGHRTLRIVGKGHKPAVIPLVPRTARTVDLAIGERREGPILVRHDGQRLEASICRGTERRLLAEHAASVVARRVSPRSATRGVSDGTSTRRRRRR